MSHTSPAYPLYALSGTCSPSHVPPITSSFSLQSLRPHALSFLLFKVSAFARVPEITTILFPFKKLYRIHCSLLLQIAIWFNYSMEREGVWGGKGMRLRLTIRIMPVGCVPLLQCYCSSPHLPFSYFPRLTPKNLHFWHQT